MSNLDVVPDSLKDEFTQEEWDGLTDAEREGMLEDDGGEEEEQQTEEERSRQEEEDAEREAAEAAAQQKADEKREQDAQAAAAAAAAGEGKTDQQKQEEAAAAAAAQEQNKPEPVTPRPRGIVDAQLPEDYEAKVKANEEAMTALEQKYDDGDISFAEFRKEQRQLDRESRDLEKLKDRADLAQETAQQAMVNQWVATINPFTAAHPELSASQGAMDEFDSILRMVNGPVQAAGGMPGQKEIDKAYRMWCASTGYTPAGGQKQTTTQQANKVPPTLGGLPAAASTSVEDGKLAAIRRLEGVEFDEAFAKLSEAEQELLLQHG